MDNEVQGELVTLNVRLAAEDIEAVRLISAYLAKQLWFPHNASRSVAVRFALRRAVATLATELQSAEKRRRTSRRRNKEKNQLRKG